MRVIYQLDTRDLKNVGEEARWAESMGYDGLYANERAHDPFLPLVLAATTTSHVTLETRVAIAFPRSPMVAAYAARDLQELSGGRFRLGLGTQVKGHNERRFSVPWVSPGQRLREYVQALHAIWENWQAGKALDFRGRFYSFSLMLPYFSPGPSPYPRPPVALGAVNPYNCRVAGEVADGLALHPMATPEYLRQVVMPNLARGAKAAGRSPGDIRVSGVGFIITGPSQGWIDAQRAAVKRQIAFYASTRTYSRLLEVHGFQDVGERLHEMSLEGRWEDMGRQISDEMLDTFAIVATYQDVAGKVKERFGGVLGEVGFQMEVSSTEERQALGKIIAELKS